MRLSTVIFFCLIIATIRAASITSETTKKASPHKSVYDYLRSIRGNKTCSSGTCPFWEQHGRSFSTLRCQAKEYQDCVCLHRMCFSSCMFTKQVCNQEMTSCLQQICPRCAPMGQSNMCPVYNSMVSQVAQSLSNFACYSCCVNAAGSANTGAKPSNTGNTGNRPANTANTVNRPANTANTARPANTVNRPANTANTARPANTVNRPANTANTARPGNTVNRPANAANTVNRPANTANTARPANTVNRPANTANTARPGNTVNRPANAANTVNRPANTANTVNRPANTANTVNRPANSGNRPANGNQGASNNLAAVSSSSNGNGGASLNQRIQKTKQTTRRVVSTGKPATVRTTTKS